MTCTKCTKPPIPDVKYAGKSYCKFHFLELMEKRIRKNLRTRQLLDVNKEYTLFDDGSSEAKLTEYFINKIFRGHLKLKISQKPSRINSIIPSNLDEQVMLFMNDFLKKPTVRKKPSQAIIPLEVLLQTEIDLICTFIGIPFKPRVKKDLLAELEKKYPGTKFSVFQSRLNLIQRADNSKA